MKYYKNLFLFFSFIGCIGFLIAIFSRQLRLCPSYSYSECAQNADSLAELLFPLLCFFVVCLITYKMPEKVFQTWAWFALPWAVLSMILIYMAPEYAQSGFGPSISLDKGFVAFIMSGLFIFASICIIVIRYIALRFATK